jgi:ABC-2 type transport system permease protein
MKEIIINEWVGYFRNKLFVFLGVFFIFFLSLVTFLGIIQNDKIQNEQKLAHEHIRAQWDGMEASNPHSAAHYGTYAFKPISVLSSIDEGISSVTGNVLRLEGHRQNDIVFSEASQSLIISKFGKLNPSLIFQFIIPLLLIFFSFNTYIIERQTGRLKLMLVQGASLRKIIFSKVLSIWFIGLLLLLLTLFIQIIFNSDNINSDVIIRLSILFLSYAFYYFILINITILLSVIFKSSTAALSLTVLTWVFWTIFFPTIMGNTTEKLSPLPTRIEFKEAMSEDRSKGIDGHNPRGERRDALEKVTLEKYNVDKLEDLPINFSGIVMQEDEEYGNMVWDKHFGNLYIQLEKQKNNYQLSGFINPFAALQNLSMGSSGSDMYHHLDFLNKAESYRRVFIKTLNDEYAFGGSKTGERGWKASNEFFRSVEDFNYELPTFLSFYTKYLIDIIILLFWVFFTSILVYFFTRKITV